jgi:hypothetical protein
MSEETKRAMLSQAAARFGVMPLARRLHVRDGEVAAWLTGHAPMPDRNLLPLVALLDNLEKESSE